ncbi:type II toxin-antitoxin system VapC family toxin [Caenimonas sp. SL110]|uniref:type II toxin-antitoxin system VapC family toxin n=1 Tax=Caenimonas sp. SL110 TaxID=1450524 RepID=UPI000653053B|nr:PIN domain-containing protein [Caenimonas sp. SL110]
MSVLVDTSVWVDHFRRRNENLMNLMSLDMALIHPMVLLELACGTPPEPRAQTLGDLALLKTAEQATLEEVTQFAEREKLYGLGCGLVDLALLASTLVTPGASLWSFDRRLVEVAQRFGVAHRPDLKH